MKFSKIVFWIAGIWGFLILTPLYFLYDRIGQMDPPPLTHPLFFYGFVGVALAWQFAFIAIARDPARLRPMMIPSILEKISFVGAALVLYQQHRITAQHLPEAASDAILLILFVIAFFKSKDNALASTPRQS